MPIAIRFACGLPRGLFPRFLPKSLCRKNRKNHHPKSQNRENQTPNPRCCCLFNFKKKIDTELSRRKALCLLEWSSARIAPATGTRASSPEAPESLPGSGVKRTIRLLSTLNQTIMINPMICTSRGVWNVDRWQDFRFHRDWLRWGSCFLYSVHEAHITFGICLACCISRVH